MDVMMQRTRRTVAILGIVLLFGCLTRIAPDAAASSADGTSGGTVPSAPAFAIQQAARGETGYFSVELRPGESAELLSIVRTVDSIPVTLRAYAANVSSAPNGGFKAATDADAPAGPTSWVSFPAQSFELERTDSLEIPFSVTVPAGTAPGQYITSLVAQTDGEPLAIEGTTFFDQIIRSAIAVVITVPGEQTAGFALGAPEFIALDGSARLVIPIANSGNVLVKPAGAFTIKTPGGDVVTDAEVTMQSVYAFTATTVEINLPAQFAEGSYLVAGSLTDPESGATDAVDPSPATFKWNGLPATSDVPFALDPVSITAVGEPVQYADVAITVNNQSGQIPTGKIVLRVSKDGAPVEDYVLVQNQAMPTGTSTIADRYIPAGGWQAGTYSFELVVSSVSRDGAETVIATVPVPDTITVS